MSREVGPPAAHMRLAAPPLGAAGRLGETPVDLGGLARSVPERPTCQGTMMFIGGSCRTALSHLRVIDGSSRNSWSASAEPGSKLTARKAAVADPDEVLMGSGWQEATPCPPPAFLRIPGGEVSRHVRPKARAPQRAPAGVRLRTGAALGRWESPTQGRLRLAASGSRTMHALEPRSRSLGPRVPRPPAQRGALPGAPAMRRTPSQAEVVRSAPSATTSDGTQTSRAPRSSARRNVAPGPDSSRGVRARLARLVRAGDMDALADLVGLLAADCSATTADAWAPPRLRPAALQLTAGNICAQAAELQLQALSKAKFRPESSGRSGTAALAAACRAEDSPDLASDEAGVVARSSGPKFAVDKFRCSNHPVPDESVKAWCELLQRSPLERSDSELDALVQHLGPSVGILEHLPDLLRRRFFRYATAVSSLPGDLLFEQGAQGDAVFVVLKGMVAAQIEQRSTRDSSDVAKISAANVTRVYRVRFQYSSPPEKAPSGSGSELGQGEESVQSDCSDGSKNGSGLSQREAKRAMPSRRSNPQMGAQQLSAGDPFTTRERRWSKRWHRADQPDLSSAPRHGGARALPSDARPTAALVRVRKARRASLDSALSLGTASSCDSGSGSDASLQCTSGLILHGRGKAEVQAEELVLNTVAVLGPTSSFGEKGVVGSDRIRKASIVATEPCILLRVRGGVLRSLVRENRRRQKLQLRKVLRASPALRPFSDRAIRCLADTAQHRRFGRSEAIAKEGDVADGVFVIKAGVAVVSRKVALPPQLVSGMACLSGIGAQLSPARRADKLSAPVQLVGEHASSSTVSSTPPTSPRRRGALDTQSRTILNSILDKHAAKRRSEPRELSAPDAEGSPAASPKCCATEQPQARVIPESSAGPIAGQRTHGHQPVDAAIRLLEAGEMAGFTDVLAQFAALNLSAPAGHAADSVTESAAERLASLGAISGGAAPGNRHALRQLRRVDWSSLQWSVSVSVAPESPGPVDVVFLPRAALVDVALAHPEAVWSSLAAEAKKLPDDDELKGLVSERFVGQVHALGCASDVEGRGRDEVRPGGQSMVRESRHLPPCGLMHQPSQARSALPRLRAVCASLGVGTPIGHQQSAPAPSSLYSALAACDDAGSGCRIPVQGPAPAPVQSGLAAATKRTPVCAERVPHRTRTSPRSGTRTRPTVAAPPVGLRSQTAAVVGAVRALLAGSASTAEARLLLSQSGVSRLEEAALQRGDAPASPARPGASALQVSSAASAPRPSLRDRLLGLPSRPGSSGSQRLAGGSSGSGCSTSTHRTDARFGAAAARSLRLQQPLSGHSQGLGPDGEPDEGNLLVAGDTSIAGAARALTARGLTTAARKMCAHALAWADRADEVAQDAEGPSGDLRRPPHAVLRQALLSPAAVQAQD